MTTDTYRTTENSRATVNSSLRFLSLVTFALVTLLATTTAARGNGAADLDVLRVDVPLENARFRNGELQLGALITNNTYIDIEDFNLRAIELEASSTRNGEVRLKVGRYVTPAVPLPDPNNQGLLRIEAPHKSNKSWRLLIEDRVSITSLTAVLEPRDNRMDYASRYENRGYTLGRDDNYRPYSQYRNDGWPYSWLNNGYDYNRRSAHWFWLNNPRTSSFFNPGYGNRHRHGADCYDRFGRHLSFNNGFNRNFSRNRSVVPATPTRRPTIGSPPARGVPPVARRAESSASNAQQNQAAQAALQQQAQRQSRQQQIRQEQIRQQRQRQQQRRDAIERRNFRSFGSNSDRSSSDRRSTQRRVEQRRMQRSSGEQRRIQER